MNEAEQNANNKEYMVYKIKQWLAMENKIGELSRQLKELRNAKKELNVDLMEIMKTNEIDCFDCNSGKISYTRTNVKKSINKKYLANVLQQFYGDQHTKEAEDVCNFILDNREITVRENIKLKKNK